ncbi:L,D-transpeptidase [Candidatus Saccharibacteria bacterium]|nr:MAG: L,D-transpeptidase [Candidatus Saccharibacteria bacterium]
MTNSELVSSATASAQAIKINLKGAKQTTVALLDDLGVKVDAQATAKAAMKAKRGGLAPLTIWDNQNVPLIYKLDEQVFAAYMQKHFGEEWLPPQNATISFNAESKTFDVVAGIPGKGSNLSQFRQALDAAMAKPGVVNLTITPTPIAPKVSNAAAETAKKQADTFLTSDITMLRGGQVVFTLEPQEIATLLDITADATRGTISVSPNGDKVQAFVDGPVQNTVNRAARDQVVVVDPNTRAESIIQAGASGIALANRPALSTSITTALREHQPLAVELTVTQSPFASKTISGSGRWIDVNLSSQTATLFIDNTVFASYVISSGRAATPTNVGEFYIRSKYPMQTMSGTINGEYYNVPNIPWVSYFNSDGEAFHGTYWHSNFGTPMSHGCINMRIEDAKVVYDFAPIGTRVTVHY